ncbi:MAG TPA: hypothetical protein EYP56_04610 [Planctomycetaceae bacterium]|nr:hypothetical protein [Planctomycetaceae bacterium]HIQ20146.1 hypothetical protein [Planctomycetota bacterium]
MESGRETAVTEITITPDGRVFLFGTSRQVIDVLSGLSFRDPAWEERLAAVRRLGDEPNLVSAAAASQPQCEEPTGE